MPRMGRPGRGLALALWCHYAAEAQSPTQASSSAAARSPAMHTPLSSPVHTPDWGTPMGEQEQDSRVQTTVLTDEQIAAMVSGGPTPPSSAKKRGLGARRGVRDAR